MSSAGSKSHRTLAPAALLKMARNFACDYVATASAGWEQAGTAPPEAFQEAGRRGLTGILVPKEMGGQALGIVEALPILEALAGANAAFAFALWVHNNVSNSLARSGNRVAALQHLPAMLAGEHIGAFCLTEPDKGSDATGISTLAKPKRGGWVLDGAKAWVTNGIRADVLMVYAQTKADAGARGIAAFLVSADLAGVERGEAYDLPGAAAFGVSDVRFRHCALDDAAMLVTPGEGFKAAMAGINEARAFVGALCCGMLASGIETALKYTAARKAFGKPVLEFQAVQWLLADTATELEAARLLTRHAAEALDRGEAGIEEAAHAKKFASRAAFEGVSRCIQCMGAAGLRADFPLARHLVAAKMTHFLDGTTEMQNLTISRMLALRHGLNTE